MKKLFCITSHCNSEEKLKILERNIAMLKNYKFDILLISHIPLSKDIISNVNYFIYDSNNQLLTYPDRFTHNWGIRNINDKKVKLNCYLPDYGWSHLNQLKIIGNYCKFLDYDYFTFINYDTMLTFDMLEYVMNINSNFLASNPVFRDEPERTLKFPSLIFFQFCKSSLLTLSSLFSKEEYIDEDNNSEVNFVNAEEYFNHIIHRENLSYETYSEPVLDVITNEYSNPIPVNINLNTENDYYSLFFDKNFIILYDLKNKIKFKINNIDVIIEEGYILDKNEVKTIGFYDFDDELVDATHLLEYRENNIFEIKVYD